MEITQVPLQHQPNTQPSFPANVAAGGHQKGTGVLQRSASVASVPRQPGEASVKNNTEEQRQAQVHRAAKAFNDFFPVNDVVFTIYKDSSGQYVTRFTNLRDGKVTYMPEPDLYNFMGRSGGAMNNVEIKA